MGKHGTVGVFRRLFVLLLVLMVVVFTVLAGFFVAFVDQQREVEMSGQTNRVTNSAFVIEQQIAAVSNVQLQLLNDTRIVRLSQGLYPNEYEKYQLILDVLTTIQTTQTMNRMIDDILITFPAYGIELSAQSGYSKKVYRTVEEDEETGFSSDQLTVSGGVLEMTVAYPLRSSMEEDYAPDYVIRILLSQDYLDDYIESFRNEDLEGAFWVLTGEEGARILFSEDSLEAELLDHWNRAWGKADRPDFLLQQTSCEHGEYVFVSQYIGQYGLALVTYQDSNAIAWKVGGSLWIVLGAMVLMAGIFGLIVIWANHSVNKPLRKIMDAFEQVRAGELSVRIFHKNNDEFDYIYNSFNSTVETIEGLIENIKEQKELLQNAELMQLQSQINPHFLYNSFYNIKFMAQNEAYDQIETMVTALAKYYRFINKAPEMNVTLAMEAEHMDNYIEIQQMRFGDKITVRREPVPAEVAGVRVPKLILQPVIENAYNYGLKDKLEGGLLSIRYELEGKMLTIAVEDNGGTMTPQKLAAIHDRAHTYEGDARNHALTNIQRRLMLAYGGHCGISLEIGEQQGLIVKLHIDTAVKL